METRPQRVGLHVGACQNDIEIQGGRERERGKGLTNSPTLPDDPFTHENVSSDTHISIHIHTHTHICT